MQTDTNLVGEMQTRSEFFEATAVYKQPTCSECRTIDLWLTCSDIVISNGRSANNAATIKAYGAGYKTSTRDRGTFLRAAPPA